MARLVGGDFSEERPVLKWSQESKDWFEPIARERCTTNLKRDRADPLYPRGLHEGDGLYFGRGLIFPDPPSPLKVILTKLPGNILADFLGGFGFVSDRIKVKIEELEPNIHQFLPLILEMPDGAVSQQHYWAFCNMNMLDTLVLEKSEFIQPYYFNREKWPKYYEYEEFGDHINKPVLAIDKTAISGKAVWFDYKIGIGKMFFSNEFSGWLDSEGITGWEANDGFSRRTTIIETERDWARRGGSADDVCCVREAV